MAYASSACVSASWFVKLTNVSAALILVLCLETAQLLAAPGVAIPLGLEYQLVYEGGMRLEAGTFGSSRIAYSVGAIAVDEAAGMIWIAGHDHHYSVGAFELLEPVKSFDPADLPIAANLQPFVKVQPPVYLEGEPGRITGLQEIGGRLFVNTAEYYDANCSNKNTTVIFDDAHDLNGSNQIGYFQMAGRVHAAGWMMPLPRPWQKIAGGSYLAGHASNLPINSCHSIGPSLFVWDPASVFALEAGSVIETAAMIDYSLAAPLSGDSYNESGDNFMWTELSAAYIGFVPPGSADYLVIGTSGGHESGIGYKIVQDNGNRCGGPCAHEHDDYYNYFWRYDLNDVRSVARGENNPSAVRPVDVGVLPVFDGQERGRPFIIGAAFASESARLYLFLGSADSTQSRYETQPLLLVYSLWRRSDKVPKSPSSALSCSCVAEDCFCRKGECGCFPIGAQ